MVNADRGQPPPPRAALGAAMRASLVLLALMSLAFAPAPLPRDEARRIEGHWLQVRGPNVGMALLIEPGRMVFIYPPPSRSPVVYDLTLDPRKRPATCDMANPGRKEAAVVGISKVEGGHPHLLL